MPTRNVLIAINDSEHSERAFDWYFEKVRMPEDQVMLIHVVEGAQIPAPTLAHGPSHSREEWDDMMQRLQAEALKVTGKYEEKCEATKTPHKTLSAVGCVGEAICEIGKSGNADLVIIGNRGLGAIRRTFLGSISDYVIQHSDIPVVVVPPKSA